MASTSCSSRWRGAGWERSIWPPTGDAGFEKFCVIKKIIAERSDRAKANRFLDEAKVVLRLSHANLVPTFDAGEIDGEFFIAMDLVEGKDLREIWNRCVRTRTRIPLDVALHVGREVARALSYVHGYGDLNLVHRDVAPPNILLSYFGEVKLTDFGLARSVLKKEQTAPGVVFGRASYLAPEQARGEVADARTDVYSLGIVLWELLTGNQYLQLANLDPATAMSLVRHPRPQTPSAKAPWITPALDKLLDARAGAGARGSLPVGRGAAPGAGRRDGRGRAARRHRAGRRLRARPVRRRRSARSARSARSCSPRPSCCRPRLQRHRRPPTPLPAVTPPPESARDTAPARPAISLEALERAAVPVAPRPVAAAVPGLAFPREEETLGVDFVGRVIDNRYRVLRKIGEGGMGTVYAAEHVEIGKVVAIKILHPHYSTEQELVERFRREARAASRIGHPNIIDVMDFGTTEDGCAYFVMEHLDGIDLADVLSHERRLDAEPVLPDHDPDLPRAGGRARRRRHPPRPQAREHLPGRARRQGRLRQGARLRRRAQRGPDARGSTNPGIAMGTPEYMAPEQAAGGVVDHRGDIYSVGALLYEMVTGQPPQKRDGEIVGPRSLRLQLSEDLDRIIVRALAPGSGAALPVDGADGIRSGEVAVGPDARGRRSARPAPGRGARRSVAARHRRPAQPADAAAGSVAGRRGARTAGRAPDRDARVESGAAAAMPPAPVLGATETTSETTPLPTPQPLIVRSPPPPRGTVPGPGVRAARAVPVPARGLAAAAVAAQR